MRGWTDLRLVLEGGIVELQAAERLPKVTKLVGVSGEQAAEHHGLHLLVASQRLLCSTLFEGDGVTDTRVCHRLDAGRQVAHFARIQLVHLPPTHTMSAAWGRNISIGSLLRTEPESVSL